MAEPLVLRIGRSEPTHQGYIEILDLKSGRRVVTVIEILCPANKVAGAGRDLYLRKQDELRDGCVSLVELDLVRAGHWTIAAPLDLIPESHRTTFAISVRRGHRSLDIEYYRAPLRERLPAIGIPLREGDQDIPLNLQAILDECYEAGRYDADINYQAPLEPPLDPLDEAWAAALLRERGLR